MGSKEAVDISRIEGVNKGQNPEEIIQNPASFSLYSQIYNGLKRRLVVNAPVPEDVYLSVIGNNTLLPSVLSLRPLDREPLEGVPHPGKSCHIEHTRSVAIACLTMLGRVAKREDHLYRVTPKELRLIGIIAIYAPTVRRSLHVRLVPTHFQAGDIPESVRKAFVELLNDGKHKIPQDPTRQGIRRG